MNARYKAEPSGGSGKEADWDRERIRALRGHLRLTQREMADKLGTRQQTISEWETGVYRPRGLSAKLLSLIAERPDAPYRIEGASKGEPEGEGHDKGRQDRAPSRRHHRA